MTKETIYTRCSKIKVIMGDKIGSSAPHLEIRYADEVDMMSGEVYDWALDDGALVYDPPKQKYLCPDGHECYESSKYFCKGYILCNKCVSEDYDGGFSRGLYIPISNENVIKING